MMFIENAYQQILLGELQGIRPPGKKVIASQLSLLKKSFAGEKKDHKNNSNNNHNNHNNHNNNHNNNDDNDDNAE